MKTQMKMLKVSLLHSLMAAVMFFVACSKVWAAEPSVYWWNNTSNDNAPGITLSWEVMVPYTYTFEGEVRESAYSTGDCVCEVYRGDTKIGEVGPIAGVMYFFQDVGARVPNEYTYWINVVPGPVQFKSEPSWAIRCGQSCDVNIDNDDFLLDEFGGREDVSVSAQWETLKAETIYGPAGYIDPIGVNYSAVVSPVEWDAASDVDWLSLSKNGTMLTISADTNKTPATRTGHIDILVHGWKIKTISVAQDTATPTNKIIWGDPNGYAQPPYDGPGCRLLFTDETKTPIPPASGYGTTYEYSSGENKYIVYRDDVAIASGITSLDGWNWFNDYDVEPGRSYTYEVKLVDSRLPADEWPTTGPSSRRCEYNYTAVFSSGEVSFDKAGGERDITVSIYKKTAEESLYLGYYDSYYTVTYDSDWFCAYRSDMANRTHNCVLEVDANDSGSPREGIVNIEHEGVVFQIKVKQAGDSSASAYTSWTAANGVAGAWNEKDQHGIYNVFRYVFGEPIGTFERIPLIDISFSGGKVAIKTPPIVNAENFVLKIVASDKPDGTGNTKDYPLDASGVTPLEEDSSVSRFFHIEASEAF